MKFVIVLFVVNNGDEMIGRFRRIIANTKMSHCLHPLISRSHIPIIQKGGLDSFD